MTLSDSPLARYPLPELFSAPEVWRQPLAQLQQDADAGAWSAVCHGLQEMLQEMLAFFTSVSIVAQDLTNGTFDMPNQPLQWRGLLNGSLSTIRMHPPGPLAEAVLKVFRAESDPAAHVALLGLAESKDPAAVSWDEWLQTLFGSPRYPDVPTCQRLAVWAWRSLYTWMLAAEGFFHDWPFEIAESTARISHSGFQVSLFPFYTVVDSELCVLSGFWQQQPRWRSLISGRMRWTEAALPAWMVVVSTDQSVAPAWSGLHPDFAHDERKIRPATPLNRLDSLIADAGSGYVFVVGDTGLGRAYLLQTLEQERAAGTGPAFLSVSLSHHDVPDARLWLARVDEALRQRPPLRGTLPAPGALRAMLAGIEDPADRFSAWLTAASELNGGSIILALDLADAPEGEGVGSGLADFLPDELPSQVVVLISCFPERQPVADATRMEALRHAGARGLELEKNSTANLDVLNDWLKDRDLHDATPPADLMKKADYRILWLRLFNRAFAANLFDSNRQLLNAWDFYQAILRQMSDRLGKRVFETRALPMLLALGQAPGGLPGEVLWQWDGYRSDTAQLVSRLGLLLRDAGAGRVQLVHGSLGRFLTQQYAPALATTARQLVEQVKTVVPHLPPASPEQRFLLAHIWGWALSSQETAVLSDLLDSPTIDGPLSRWIEQLQEDGYPATALAVLQDHYLGVRKLRDDEAPAPVNAEPRLAQLRRQRGELYQHLGERQIALGEYAAAVNALTPRVEAGELQHIPPLAEALTRRARLLTELDCEAEAMEDCQTAEALLERVPEADREARYWRCRARNADIWGRLLEASDIPAAVKRLRSSLEAWRQLTPDSVLSQELAHSWLHVGDLNLTLDETARALECYGEALQQLRSVQPLSRDARTMLVRALSGRCQTRTDMGVGGQNTEDLVMLVDALEHLVHVDGQQHRQFDLALAHHSLGTLLGRGRASFRSLAHEREAVRLLDALPASDDRDRRVLLRAQALASSAQTALRLGETSWALEDATTAIEGFQEALERDSQAHVREGLVRTLGIRRDAFGDLGDWLRAHQDADRSIAVSYQGGETFVPLLAEAFVERGSILRHQRRHAHALMDLERALELLPANRTAMTPLQQRTLARVWRERGLTRAAVGDSEAAEDLERAIQVESSEDDSDDLLVERALAYADRAALGMATGELSAVGANLLEALNLWEQLVPHPEAHPDAHRVLGLARTLLHQAQFAWLSHDADRALEQANLAIELYRRPSSQESQTTSWSELAYALDMVAQIWHFKGMNVPAALAWEQAADRYEALWLQQNGNAEVAQALGDVLCHRSQAILLQHGPECALADLGRSLALYAQVAQAVVGPAEERRLRLRQSLAHLGRARILLDEGGLPAASGEASRALQLAAALRHGPVVPGLQGHLAACHQVRAEVHAARGQLDQALEEFGRCVDALERLVRLEGAHPGLLSRVLLQRAQIRLSLGEPELSLRDCEAAARSLGPNQPKGSPWLAQVLDQTARIRFSRGESDAGVREMMQAVEIYEEAAVGRPDSEMRILLARACSWLADHEQGEHHLDEGAAWWDQAVEALKEAAPDHPRRLSETWIDLGLLALRHGGDENAEQALSMAVQVLEIPHRTDLVSPRVQALQHRLQLRIKEGRWHAALEDLVRLEGLNPEGPLSQPRLLSVKALLLGRLERTEEMRDAYKRALSSYEAVMKKNGGATPEAVHERARVHNNLAVALLEQSEAEAAQRELSRAIELRSTVAKQLVPGQLQVDLAISYYNRGTAAVAQGRPDQGLQDFETACRLLDTLSKQGVDVREKLAQALSNLGQALAEVGRPDEALERFNASLGLFKQLSMDPKEKLDTEGHGVAIFNRGALRQQQGRTDEARQDYESAARMFMRLIEHHGRNDLTRDLRACRLALHSLG